MMLSSPMPLDQADGLRRLFAHARTCVVPVVSNPHMAFGGAMLERLCSAFAEQGRVAATLSAGGGMADSTIFAIERAGVDVAALGATLQTEGAAAFVKSWDELIGVIAGKLGTGG